MRWLLLLSALVVLSPVQAQVIEIPGAPQDAAEEAMPPNVRPLAPEEAPAPPRPTPEPSLPCIAECRGVAEACLAPCNTALERVAPEQRASARQAHLACVAPCVTTRRVCVARCQAR